MKKILLFFSAILLLTSLNVTNAQPCHFGNLGVKVNSTTPGTAPGTCVINFDLYFEIEHNSGGKYFWIHIWPASSYPAFNYTEPPTTSLIAGGNGALDTSLTTFGYYHFKSILDPLLSYPPDTNAPHFQSGYTLTEIQGVPDRYTAHNLVITLPQGCNVAQQLIADAWQSQSAASQNIHCFTTNIPFYLNDPTITNGLMYCQIPRRYKFDINTLSTTAKVVNYQVRIDNGDGIYNAALDTLIIRTGTETITSTTPFQSGILDYAPYSSTKPYSDKSLWVIVLSNGADIPNDVYARIDNTCIPLPVSWSAFTAQRKDQLVQLKWSTVIESNNKGFEVQRRTGLNEWQNIAFIATLAQMGNSSDKLDYSYTETNLERGITQYRLRQEDLDGKFTYSEVRSIMGLDQKEKLMAFPNPTINGQVTVILRDNEKGADIQLIDMNGRAVRSWNFWGERLDLNGIPSGLYLLKARFRETGESQSLKLIVK